MLRYDKIDKMIAASRVYRKNFASSVGVTEQWLIKFLKGEIANPGSDKIEAIADYFGVPMDHLFDRKVQLREELLPLYEHNMEIARLNDLIKEKERTINILLNLRRRHG